MTSNLLILMSDEHQARAMGCAQRGAPHPQVHTPVLDQLAADGTRFTRAYTPSPICVPARAAFATGQPVHRIRYWDNAMPYDGAIPGWGHALQNAGVPVESIGKLHYRNPEDDLGFDRLHVPMMVSGPGQIWGSIRKAHERRQRSGGRMLGDEIGPGHSKYTRYDTGVVARTQDWLADRAARAETAPWCLYVGLVAPHFPLQVPQRFFDLYDGAMTGAAKLHPRDGHARHPWIEQMVALNDHEAQFADPEERVRAMAAYFGLVSWLDHNIGLILQALEDHGLAENTTVVYTSDHGDNVGARGLWGKSNLYEESAAIPMILRGPGIAAGATCDTPVSLLDLSATAAQHFGQTLPDCPGTPLPEIAAAPTDPDRVVFSEYHAVGAVSGAFMVVKGRYKLIHYEGFPPELFDLRADPEELENRAADPALAEVLADMQATLQSICDPTRIDELAHADQRDLVASVGGIDVALNMGPSGATPPPEL